MTNKILGLFSNKTKGKEPIKKETLEKVVDIARRDHGNVLIFISPDSYENYGNSVDILSKYIDANMQDLPFKQGKNRMDTSSSRLMTNIKNDLDRANSDSSVERLILSVFTRTLDELDELPNKCASLKDVTIYTV